MGISANMVLRFPEAQNRKGNKKGQANMVHYWKWNNIETLKQCKYGPNWEWNNIQGQKSNSVQKLNEKQLVAAMVHCEC